jgi:hypothetical protein
MKRLSHTWRVMGLGMCLLFLASGCETVQKYSLSYRLWDNEDFCKWSEPLPNPRLALFETPDHTNLLVAYDAFSEKHSVIMRQAYYLRPNQARLRAGKAPRFVPPVTAKGMEPIPVFEQSAAATNSLTQLTNYAVISDSGHAFTLHPQAEPLGDCQLPVYPESSGTALRVALTPFAAVGDTVMVGLVASVMAVILACQSGVSFTP